MSRARSLLPWVLGIALVALLTGWFFITYKRVETAVPMPPRGEAAYNPLYALKLALRADGQRAVSRQRLQLDKVKLGNRDTVVVYSDPRALSPDEQDALFAFAEDGGHLILRLPAWQGKNDNNAGDIGGWLPIEPKLSEPACMALRVPGQEERRVFCNAPRFTLADDADIAAAWRGEDGGHVFARFRYGKGSVDLMSNLSMLGNGHLADVAYRGVVRQLLAPNWGAGTFHLVYAADMPPLWRWLLEHGWMALLPLSIALLAWLWMRAQRFGPILPSPLRPRRALLEHVDASGEHLARYGRLALLHQAVRNVVLERLRRRDPLAAALEGEAQAALLAARTGFSSTEIRTTLDTRPPSGGSEIRQRIASLIALRKRL